MEYITAYLCANEGDDALKRGVFLEVKWVGGG